MNGRRPRRSASLAAAAVASAAVVLTACDPGGSTVPTSSSSSSTVADPSTSQPTVTTTSVALAPSTDGFGSGTAGYAGDSRNGSDWNFQVPRLVSGDTKIRDTYNGAMEKDADRIIADAKSSDRGVTVTNGDLTPEESSRVVIAKTTLSGTLVTLSATEGAAYPVTTVNTVVVEAGDGRQLSLDDIFTDPVLAKDQLAGLARAADTTGRLQDAEFSVDDLEQWIALDAGLHLYVPVIHTLGNVVPVTVGWDQLADQLNSTGQILFGS